VTLKASDLSEGVTFTEVIVENLTRTQIVQYAGASGDYNPLHTDEVFATQVAGYPSVFAHGMLTMGMTGRMVTALVGDGNLRSFGGRFTAQVWPGDDLTTTVTVTAVHAGDDAGGAEPTVDLAVSTANQDGTKVFSGTATAAIDA
jgi:acyl dehydratase